MPSTDLACNKVVVQVVPLFRLLIVICNDPVHAYMALGVITTTVVCGMVVDIMLLEGQMHR